MKKRLICIPFAYEKNMKTGANVSDIENSLSLYIYNSCVALITAKHYNQDCDVAFATNLDLNQLPRECKKLLNQNHIKIFQIPFDSFRFTGDMKWSLAFYKLCVLKYLAQNGEYDAICYMDTDVYVQGSFDAIWEECKENILLYDINHGLNTKDYVILCEEIKQFFGRKKLITHYGGEFLAASRNELIAFSEACKEIYMQMQRASFMTTKGDEFIISLAADKMKHKIKNAAPYIYRFWTGASFRLISTCYKYNRITVLHVPDEKEKGMLCLYRKYISKGIVPKDQVAWRILRLKRLSMLDYIKLIAKNVLSIMRR